MTESGATLTAGLQPQLLEPHGAYLSYLRIRDYLTHTHIGIYTQIHTHPNVCDGGQNYHCARIHDFALSFLVSKEKDCLAGPSPRFSFVVQNQSNALTG